MLDPETSSARLCPSWFPLFPISIRILFFPLIKLIFPLDFPVPSLCPLVLSPWCTKRLIVSRLLNYIKKSHKRLLKGSDRNTAPINTAHNLRKQLERPSNCSEPFIRIPSAGWSGWFCFETFSGHSCSHQDPHWDPSPESHGSIRNHNEMPDSTWLFSRWKTILLQWETTCGLHPAHPSCYLILAFHCLWAISPLTC